MKKLLNYLAVLIPVVSIAQKDSLQHKHKWALGVEVNTIRDLNVYDIATPTLYNTYGKYIDKSFSFGVTGNYYFSNSLSLKIKTGVTNINIFQHRDTRNEYGGTNSGYYSITNDTNFQRNFYVNFGLQGNVTVNKIIDLFVGLQIPLTIYGSYSYSGTEAEYDTVGGNLQNLSYSKTVIPGGFSIGIGPFLGFRFKVYKHIYLASEITESLIYQALGGKVFVYSSGIVPQQLIPTNYFQFNPSGWVSSGPIVSITLLILN